MVVNPPPVFPQDVAIVIFRKDHNSKPMRWCMEFSLRNYLKGKLKADADAPSAAQMNTISFCNQFDDILLSQYDNQVT